MDDAESLSHTRWECKYHVGTSKNRRYFSDAAKLPANDSVSFSFRFMDVHSGRARDRHRDQFFEVPMWCSFPSAAERRCTRS
jgi:hypothetical protein